MDGDDDGLYSIILLPNTTVTYLLLFSHLVFILNLIRHRIIEMEAKNTINCNLLHIILKTVHGKLTSA